MVFFLLFFGLGFFGLSMLNLDFIVLIELYIYIDKFSLFSK